MDDKYKQNIHTAFYQLFNMLGAFTHESQVDKLRTFTHRIATAIQDQVKVDTVEIIRKLQNAIDSAFKDTFNTVNDIDKKLAELESKLRTLSGKVEEQLNEISNSRSGERQNPTDLPDDNSAA
jgi:predicted  nucleic acid-binding Zn-ribbon protein